MVLLGGDFYLWFLLQPTIGKYSLKTLQDYWQSRKKVLLNFLIFEVFEIVATAASIWVLRKVSFLKQANSSGDLTWLMGTGWAEMGSFGMWEGGGAPWDLTGTVGDLRGSAFCNRQFSAPLAFISAKSHFADTHLHLSWVAAERGQAFPLVLTQSC